jgi:hypothetical protein
VIDARQYVFDTAVIALAGPVAVPCSAPDRGRRLDPLGLPRERRVAIHEAGHVIAALAAERFVHEAEIIPCGLSGGHVVASTSAVPPRPNEENVDSDRSQAARLALLLAPFDLCQWKAILRMVRMIRR